MIYNPKLIIKENSRMHDHCVDRARVIVVGPASPSTGGIPSYIDELLASQLKNCYPLELFDPLAIKSRSEKQESRLNLKEIIDGIKVLRAFVEAMKMFKPTMVHIHTSSYWGFYEKTLMLLIAKYIFRNQTILHIHGGEFGIFYKKTVSKSLINWLLKQANRILIVSKAVNGKLGLKRTTLVDNCVRFDNAMLFKDKKILKLKYGIPSNKTVFLSAALFMEKKGIIETLVAFRNIFKERKDFCFLVAGEGPERSRILDFLESNKLDKNVKVMDFIAGQEKEDIFSLSDVFILNSSVESFGISLVEAVSHGLFVISTPVGIASDAENVFNDGNCIRVPIKNTKALERAILTVLDKKIDIDTITKKNFYDFKDRFDVKPVFEKMKQIYEEVLNVRGSN